MGDVRVPWSRRLAGLATVAAAAVALAGLTTTPAAAQGQIVGAGSPGAIAGSYIVVFNNGANPSVSDLAARHQARVGFTYSQALRGFSATMSETQAKRLALNPAVAFVEQNQIVRTQATQPNPPSWGLDRIDQRNLPLDSSYTYPNNGAGVRAYIVDTGIRISHTDFGGRAVHGRDTVDNDNDASDCNGHGTHVAGTVGGNAYGVAKGTTLVAVRVLDCQGSGTLAGVAAGVDWVTGDHAAGVPAVANMSLGAQGTNATLETAVNNSINDGVTYGIAAGNGDIFGNPQNACNFTPARVPAAITVGATQNNDAKATFSNFGTCLDIFAPGVGITSAWFTNDTATNTISGTSMATPHVVGAAAVYLGGHPGSTPQQVRDGLVNDATNGVVTSPGTGSPNKLLYINNGPVQNRPVVTTGNQTGTVGTAVNLQLTATGGTPPYASWAVSGLPAGLSASSSGLITGTPTAAGTSTVTATVTDSASETGTGTFTWTINPIGGNCTTATNGTDINIPDNNTNVSSTITFSGCSGNASSTTRVAVNIVHTYRGDLVIDLIAPDGSAYRLKNSNLFDSADNVIATYTVNASSETKNGTWQLRVRDIFPTDTGYINSFGLTF